MIYPHELIGQRVEIINAKNSSLIGIKGNVIDETKNTIILETDEGTKTLLKQAILKVKLQSGEEITLPTKRAEERIKGK